MIRFDLDRMILNVEALAATGARGYIRIDLNGAIIGEPLTQDEPSPHEDTYLVSIGSHRPQEDCTYHPGWSPREVLVRQLEAQAAGWARLRARRLENEAFWRARYPTLTAKECNEAVYAAKHHDMHADHGGYRPVVPAGVSDSHAWLAIFYLTLGYDSVGTDFGSPRASRGPCPW